MPFPHWFLTAFAPVGPWFEVVGKLAALVTALAVLWKLVVKPLIERLIRPGYEEWKHVRAAIGQIDKVWREFGANGGASLRDAVTRIEKATARNEARTQILLHEAPQAVFFTDAKGRAVYVNRTYMRWTGRSDDELLGDGWVNIIHPDERERVLKDWNQAVEYNRNFETRFRCLDGDRLSFPVFMRASWLGPECGYCGLMMREGVDGPCVRRVCPYEEMLQRAGTLQAASV